MRRKLDVGRGEEATDSLKPARGKESPMQGRK